MKSHFHNKVVIVTGASSGIGKETALAFGRAGARVIMVARRGEMLRQIASENPQLQLRPLPADITHSDAAVEIVATTLREFGRIDILVNNAGIGQRGLFAELDFGVARRVMDLNFFALLRCTQAVVPVMRRQGSGQIVNISSVVGMIATPQNSIYCASKFAVRSLSDSLRLELRASGIDVISILPGHTETQFFENQIITSGPSRFGSMRGQLPSHVATVILRACRHRRREVVLTLPCILGCWAKRLFPGFVDWCLMRLV
ncbi:MAG: SDR family NAD(P)-dependent oxidoreductase [Verrucomicrobiota bacterium]